MFPTRYLKMWRLSLSGYRLEPSTGLTRSSLLLIFENIAAVMYPSIVRELEGIIQLERLIKSVR